MAWTAPAGVAVTGYEAQHRRQGETAWTAYANPFSASAVALTLPDLQPGAVYEAQVRALTAAGPGDWSDTGEGQANRPPHRRVWFYGNNNVSVGVWYRDWNPATRYFGDADGDTLSFFESSDNDALVTSWVGDNGYTFNTFAHNPGRSTITYGVRDGYGGEITRTVVYSAYANGVRRMPESPKGFYVGHPVAGVKTRHNYQISPYTLTGEAAATFDIDQATAQVTLKPGHTLDYETKTAYTGQVKYTVNGGDATIGLTIEVTDIPAPARPAPPTVTAVEGYAAALNLAWAAPNSHGSPITGYNLRHRPRGGNSGWIDRPVDGAGVSTVLTGLADTNYEAQVQASAPRAAASGPTAATSARPPRRRAPIRVPDPARIPTRTPTPTRRRRKYKVPTMGTPSPTSTGRKSSTWTKTRRPIPPWAAR